MADFRLPLPTGITVAGSRTGAGGGVPLIFSHGLFMDRTMFAPQLDHFAGRFDCVVWDERAHGGTASSGPFTYWDSAGDLLAMMDALGIDRALHIGMSQGGLLGMRAALTAPERFVGIVQLASQAGKLDEEAANGFRGIIAEWIDRGATEEKIGFLTDLILGPGVDPGYWRSYWSSLTPQQIEEAVSALYAIDELYDRLAEVRIPACVIHGFADVSTPYQLAERVARGLPDCRGLTLIAGGPHAVNLSDPGAVNAAIDRFIATLGIEDSEEMRA